MSNEHQTTFKIIFWILIFYIILVLAYSATCWALFYDAETERLSSSTSKNMRIASICILVFTICTTSFLTIWILSFFRNQNFIII